MKKKHGIFDYKEKILLAFILYCWVRELFGYCMGVGINTLLPALYYTFSFLLFVSVRRYMNNEDKMRLLYFGLMISLVISMISIYLFGLNINEEVNAVRSVGTYNNPNQLGYYSVILISIASYGLIRKIINLSVYLVFFFGAIILCIMSLSKAAIISVMSLVIVYVIIFLKERKLNIISGNKYIYAILMLGFIMIYNINNIKSINYEDLAIYKRFYYMFDEKDTDMKERGYGVFSQASAEEMLFGISSEGVISRHGAEVHSTFMSPITSYGIIGGGMFCAFFVTLIIGVADRYGIKNAIILFLPVILYGISHNGTRFSAFWLFLSVMFVSANNKKIINMT
ncbi:MAG: hypothetical protein HGB12_08980 [Bacteroidetes bacterium]|nr:hypothetical protein [Bacteroidota bacterium]